MVRGGGSPTRQRPGQHSPKGERMAASDNRGGEVFANGNPHDDAALRIRWRVEPGADVLERRSGKARHAPTPTPTTLPSTTQDVGAGTSYPNKARGSTMAESVCNKYSLTSRSTRSRRSAATSWRKPLVAAGLEPLSSTTSSRWIGLHRGPSKNPGLTTTTSTRLGTSTPIVVGGPLPLGLYVHRPLVTMRKTAYDAKSSPSRQERRAWPGARTVAVRSE